MAKQITPFSITAPGFYGLNTQDAPIDMDKGFALQATNCIIDKSGRVASRKGWAKAHTANANLGSGSVEVIGELVENSGTSTVLAAGNGYLFKLSGTTLTTLTYGGGGVAPTILANKWYFCQLNGVAMFWQRGYDPLIYDPAVSTTTFRRLNEKVGTAGTVEQANVAISAYGRVWCADTATNKNTVWWSDLLSPHVWTGGSSGSVNLLNVWPRGGDEIVALAAHNNFLFIFGKKQVVIYGGADTPSSMTISDTIVGIGCISRDTVQNIGEDVWFLSDNGLRSLERTIQEKSAPFRQLSKNVHDDIRDLIDSATPSLITSGYSATEGFYLLHFPAVGITYCFNTQVTMQDGSARVTTWNNIAPTAFCETNSRKFYLGQAGYIGQYSTYLDDATEYRMDYYTSWIDFGNPIQTSILKKILLNAIGGTNQSIVFKWAYDFVDTYFTQTVPLTVATTEAYYNEAEYNSGAEYISNVAANILSVNGSSAGRVIKFGFEAQINDKSLSIQKIDLFTKDGRL